MIRRLLEVHYLENRETPTPERVGFWLRELRTSLLLQEVARAHPLAFQTALPRRLVLKALMNHQEAGATVEEALRVEEDEERQRDREYWQPLRAELEALRRQR